MEIIHVVLGKANPDRMNGVNKVVHQLATQQKNAGLQVRLWGITKDTTHNYPARNFETTLFREGKNKFVLDRDFKTAISRKQDKAVFHLHGGFNPQFYAVSKALHELSLPYVFTPHGAYNKIAMEKSWLRKKIYMHLFERHLLKRSAAIHCLGGSEVDGLKLVFPDAKWALIPYGFEPNRENVSIPEYHKFIIGYCGRIDIHTKGIDAMIKAYSSIKKSIPHAELWIIGDGPERPILEKMITDEKLSDVTLWGSKYGDEKDDLIRQMHVFLHPSRNEGLPSAVLEASSMGIPCVVTRATNVGDAITKHQSGKQISETNASELCQAVLDMHYTIKTQGWKKMSDAAREMVRQEYNWNSILTRFNALYKEVCP